MPRIITSLHEATDFCQQHFPNQKDAERLFGHQRHGVMVNNPYVYDAAHRSYPLIPAACIQCGVTLTEFDDLAITTMNKQQWDSERLPARMIAYIRQHPNKYLATNRKMRLWAVACCCTVAARMTERGRDALCAAEVFADDQISADVLHSFDILVPRPSLVSAVTEPEDSLAGLGLWIADLIIDNVIHGITRYGVTAGIPHGLQASLLHDVVGNPFAPLTLPTHCDLVPAGPWQVDNYTVTHGWTAPYCPWLTWNDGIVVKMAQAIYDDRAFDRLPILADALEDAGCDDTAMLMHLRGDGPHVRGCHVVDLLLGKT